MTRTPRSRSPIPTTAVSFGDFLLDRSAKFLREFASMKIRIQSLGVIASALITFALQPIAHAVNPPPDGCYSNFTTAEGCDALNSLSTGQGNTAIGWRSLFDNSIGNYNTGIGSGALALN